MFEKIKVTFLNKKFLIFCIIGLVAYFIHQAIYLLYTKAFNFYDDKNHLISTAVAFFVASVFTYFFNAKYTYNEKASRDTFIKSFIVFIFKFLLTEVLALLIMLLINKLLSADSKLYKAIDIMLPLILTCLTLILQFLAFNIIFKKEEKNM